ncbi:uncharacterized protein LOC135473238 isoform X2 [Liolophura sinensis]|uniref:uncharacterized protein LOC135473238 isoform X2 n=1 Tax=Liolophura sinensis TaxID=3198878 RepID=UPI003158D127
MSTTCVSEGGISEEKASELDYNEKSDVEEELEIVDEVGDLDDFDVLDEVDDEDDLSLDEISDDDDDEPGLKRKDEVLKVRVEKSPRSTLPVKCLTAEDLTSPYVSPVLNEITAALSGKIKANKDGVTEILLQGSKEANTNQTFTKAKKDMLRNKVKQFQRSGRLPGLAEGSLIFVRKIPIDAGAGLLKSLFPNARNILLPRSDDGLNLGFAILQPDKEEDKTFTVQQPGHPVKTQRGSSLSNISSKSHNSGDNGSMGSSLPEFKLSKTAEKPQGTCNDSFRTHQSKSDDLADNDVEYNPPARGRGFKRGMSMRGGRGLYHGRLIGKNQGHQDKFRGNQGRGMQFRGSRGVKVLLRDNQGVEMLLRDSRTSFRGKKDGGMSFRDNDSRGKPFRGNRGRGNLFRGNRGFQRGMPNSRERGLIGGRGFNHLRNDNGHSHRGRGFRRNFHRQAGDSHGEVDHYVSIGGAEMGDHRGDDTWGYTEDNPFYKDDLRYEDDLCYEDAIQYDDDPLQEYELQHEDDPRYDDLRPGDNLHYDGDQYEPDIRYRDRRQSTERYEEDIAIGGRAYSQDDSVSRHPSPEFECYRERFRMYDRRASIDQQNRFPDDHWHSRGKRKRSASPYRNRGKESYHDDSAPIRDDLSDSHRSRRSWGQGSTKKIVRTEDGELLIADSSREPSEGSRSSELRGRPWRPGNRGCRKREGSRDFRHQEDHPINREGRADRMSDPRSRSRTPGMWRKPVEDSLSPERQLHSPSPDRKSGRVTPLQSDVAESRMVPQVGGLEETSDRGGIILTRTLNGDILLSTAETATVKPVLPLTPVDHTIERHVNAVRTIEASIGLPDSSLLEDKRGRLHGRSPAEYRASKSPGSRRSGSRCLESATGGENEDNGGRRRGDRPRHSTDTYRRSASKEFNDYDRNRSKVHRSRSPQRRGLERLSAAREYEDARGRFHDDDGIDEHRGGRRPLPPRHYQKQNVHYSSRDEGTEYDEDERSYIRSDRSRSHSRASSQPFEHNTQDNSRRVFASGHQRFAHPGSSQESDVEDYAAHLKYTKPKSRLDTKTHIIQRADAKSYKVRIRNDYYSPNKPRKHIKNRGIEESFEAIDSEEDSESLVMMDGAGIRPESDAQSTKKHDVVASFKNSPEMPKNQSENFKNSQVSPKTNIPLGAKHNTIPGKKLSSTHKSASPISPSAGGRYFNRSTTLHQMSGKVQGSTSTTSVPSKPHPAASAGVKQTSSGGTTSQSSLNVSRSFKGSQQSAASLNTTSHPTRLGSTQGSLIQLTTGSSKPQQGSVPAWKTCNTQKAKWLPKKPFQKKNPRWMGQKFQSANQPTNTSADVSDVRRMLINQLQLLEQGVQTDPSAISNIAQQLKKLGHQKHMQASVTQGSSSLPSCGNANLSSGSGQGWTASLQNQGYSSSSQASVVDNQPYCGPSGVSQAWQRFPTNSGGYGSGVQQYGDVTQTGLGTGPQIRPSNPHGSRSYTSHQYSNSTRQVSSSGNVPSSHLGNSQTFSSAPVYQTPQSNSRIIWPS